MFKVFLFLSALSCSACSTTIGAVSPRPGVVIGPKVTTVSLSVADVADLQRPTRRVSVADFRQTLQNGFRSAVGRHYSEDATAPLRLVIEAAELDLSNLGGLGRFLTIRYRAHWVDAAGQTLAEVAGIAEPRNPLARGPRRLEDVVEVMFEMLADGLDRATRSLSAQAPPAQPR